MQIGKWFKPCLPYCSKAQYQQCSWQLFGCDFGKAWKTVFGLQAENVGMACFDTRAGRSGLMSFKPSTLMTSMSEDPLPQITTGESSFSGSRAGKSGEASFNGRISKALQVSNETMIKALEVVTGQTSMWDLMQVGWNNETLEEVCTFCFNLRPPFQIHGHVLYKVSQIVVLVSQFTVNRSQRFSWLISHVTLQRGHPDRFCPLQHTINAAKLHPLYSWVTSAICGKKLQLSQY